MVEIIGLFVIANAALIFFAGGALSAVSFRYERLDYGREILVPRHTNAKLENGGLVYGTSTASSVVSTGR